MKLFLKINSNINKYKVKIDQLILINSKIPCYYKYFEIININLIIFKINYNLMNITLNKDNLIRKIYSLNNLLESCKELDQHLIIKSINKLIIYLDTKYLR